jgi:hypothetical protein
VIRTLQHLARYPPSRSLGRRSRACLVALRACPRGGYSPPAVRSEADIHLVRHAIAFVLAQTSDAVMVKDVAAKASAIATDGNEDTQHYAEDVTVE